MIVEMHGLSELSGRTSILSNHYLNHQDAQ